MSAEPIFKSDRSFIIVSYQCSHGLLLLRSNQGANHPTRIDILFKDVRAMELRGWFDGLEIIETDKTALLGYPSNPTAMMEVGNRVYAVKGNGWSGFIVAGIVTTIEDTGEYCTPSSLLAGNKLA